MARREAAYFDILIGESECSNPRGGVCNLIPLPVRPIPEFRSSRVSPMTLQQPPFRPFPRLCFPFPTSAVPNTLDPTLALPPSSSLHHARAANLLLIATTKHPACECVGTFELQRFYFARLSVFTDRLLRIVE